MAQLQPGLAGRGRAARALNAADDAGTEAPLRVTDAHLSIALDELLDTRNQLTRVLLGAPGQGRRGVDAVIGDPGHRDR
jgi:hypothetical protein